MDPLLGKNVSRASGAGDERHSKPKYELCTEHKKATSYLMQYPRFGTMHREISIEIISLAQLWNSINASTLYLLLGH